ncbi:hypothetical protein [Mariniphaga sediminis]|nr:hypothetical protein [Mariniphaga sediminis]
MKRSRNEEEKCEEKLCYTIKCVGIVPQKRIEIGSYNFPLRAALKMV